VAIATLPLDATVSLDAEGAERYDMDTVSYCDTVLCMMVSLLSCVTFLLDA
jgi:hypothetical protein